MSLILFIPALLAAALSAWLMMKAGVSDAPISRSSHSIATPTAGGVCIITAVGVSFLGLHFSAQDLGLFAADITPRLLAVLGAVGMLGFLDDIYHVGSKRKFLAMMIISALTVYIIGPVHALPLGLPFGQASIALPAWLGYTGAAVWIFAVMNIVNFMDGADGMFGLNMSIATGGMAALALLSAGTTGASAIGVAPLTLFWALALIAGLLAFLPFNAVPPCRLFAGDVGALSAGYIYALITLLAVAELPSSGALYLGPLFILPFIVDVLMTLYRRARTGHNVLIAHNTHLFQRLIQGGRSHIRVSFYYAFATGLCVLTGLFAEVLSIARSPFVLIIMTGITVVVYQFILSRKGQIRD